jgi:hypothetical protein
MARGVSSTDRLVSMGGFYWKVEEVET